MIPAARCLCAVSAIAMLACVPPATAQERHAVDIPAGTLAGALRTLAAQTGIAVGGTSPEMERVRTPAVRGSMTAEAALRRLLGGTRFRAVHVGGRVYRIEERPAAAAPRGSARAVPPAPPPPVVAAVDIVVTASRRDVRFDEYPGGATLIALDPRDPAEASRGLETLLERYPAASGTALGPGRNKLFLRGVADSSFNGPTQATVGLYLGELRMIYSAPNPDLRLYDMRQVELLEGPQGTLYGAGALGGVIRIEPNVPDPGGWEGRLWSHVEARRRGDPGGGVAAMVNAPLGPGVAVRASGYRERMGGYIADHRRRLGNVNRSTITGGRTALGAELGNGWRIDLLALGQRIDTRDGQYADTRLPGPGYARRSAIAQPFASTILAGSATLTGRIGDVRLVSATGIVGNRLDTRYDSSILVGGPARQAFAEARRIQLLVHETRLSSAGGGDFSWVAGLSALRNRDVYSQLVTSLDGPSPPPFANIRYVVDEQALFGEASYRLGSTVTATLGTRAVRTRGFSRRAFGPNEATETDRAPLRVLPMAALSWTPAEGMLAYARYQRSYRIGGVTVERAPSGDPVPARFDPDSLQSVEAGVRWRSGGALPVQVAASAFYTDWRDIQGDLIQAEGFPITRNIGDGRILGVTASAEVAPAPGLALRGALFVNDTALDRVAPDATISSHRLPNVAAVGAYLGAAWRHELPGGTTLTARADARYAGRSYLDLDPKNQVAQGDFLDAGLGVGVERGRYALRLDVENLFDSRGNRFAFGNPFSAHVERQATPLVPRSARLSVTIGF